MDKVKTSIIIPCYNEEKRLEPSLSRSLSYLSSTIKDAYQVVFVDDGSTDNTRHMLGQVKARNKALPIKIISYSQNQGKGYAVKMGILNSDGEKIIVMDADFSIDLHEIPGFLDKLNNFDVVVGSKKHLLTQSIKHQKIPRRILGKGFTLLTNFLLGLNFTDITCGFKGFRSHAAKELFKLQRMKSWSYDAETLFLAKKLKYKMLELPVKWIHIEGSKVSPLQDTIKSLKDLLAIILNYAYGKYTPKA